MRILSLIAMVLFVSSLAAPARAGMVEDCEQSHDRDLRIGGCTAAIRSGQSQGKDLVWAYNNRGVAHSALGEHRRAIEDYDQALRLDPRDAFAYVNRGNTYRDLGDYRRAIEDYDQALRLDPRDDYAYNGRAWALYLLGRNTEALGDVDRSLSLNPGNAYAIETRAHVLAALGRQNEALGEFERVMRVGGADWVRTYQEALAKHGYYPGAIYGGGYRPQTQAALVACLDAGCRLLE